MPSEPGLFVPPRADALIRGGHKIQAIKLVIDANPGASLRAAKDAVEAREAQLPAAAVPMAEPSATAQQGGGLPAEALEALQRGQVIEAIKLVRLAQGVDLRTAKQRVDAQMRGGAAAPPREPVRRADATVARGGDNGRLALWTLLLAIAAVAVWWAVG